MTSPFAASSSALRRISVFALSLALGATLSAQTPAAATVAIAPVQPMSPSPAVDPAVQSAQQTATDGSGEKGTRSRDERSRTPDQTVPLGPQIPSEFQQLVASTTGRMLPIFGDSLFQGVPSTFAPVTDVPVSPTYVIGPGDEIDVQIAGQVNQKLNLRVDRTGAIQVPGLGAVQVAGVPYGQLSQLLNTQFSRIYRGFTLNAQLGQLRTIQVFVVGQARRPGSYSISSMSTLLNAIFASGGPANTASVRDIQVRRGDKVIVDFDLYDLLLHGDKSHDITLQSGDVIFFPYVGTQVAILGSVDQSAIYEVKPNSTVNQIIGLAGGFTSAAAPATVRLERIHDHADRTFIDVQLATSGDMPLENGDIISVASIVDRYQNAVTLRGNVANPGRYVWHAGMHVSDLIPSKDALITRNYWTKRNQLGQSVLDYVPATDGQPTQEGSLQVHANAASTNAAARSGTSSSQAGGNSTGAALTANNNPFAAHTDVVLSAPDIDWSYAVIERLDANTLTTALIPFNLGRLVLDHDQTQNPELLTGDVITIFSKADVTVPAAQQTRFVRLEGEFVASGVYSVQPGETLRQLVTRAGGFTPDAYLYASEFTRLSTRRVEEQRRDEIANALEAQISSATAAAQARAVSAADQQAAAASQADAQAALGRLRSTPMLGRITLDFHPNSQGVSEVPEIALEDGDRFVVSKVPSDVHVQGEVYSATAFLFAPDSRVSTYLKRAGGPNRNADKKRIYVVRASGEVVSRQYTDVEKAPIYPGDTVVVPPVLDRRAIFQRVVDIAQAVSTLGIGLAAIALIAR